MSSLAISSSSIFSLSNAYHQPSRRLCFIIRNSRSQWSSNFEIRQLRLGGEARRTFLRCSKKSQFTGENENKNVLDAFFLGKALAEVINERIESTVGEVLGSIGRFQAEQQKQVQEIQEEVLERAKRAKERAARETMESQGLVTSTSIVESNTTSNENLSGFSGSSMGGVVESSSSSDEEDGL
ncbi:hypothetical protein V5N11_032242 [Cardamine amara subsp. amara]|uniref:Uncharacterized protein n=1 Tax=Cardamine amara subsp. amara TaxID=228776 RepID=A0ABD1A951_CARAN